MALRLRLVIVCAVIGLGLTAADAQEKATLSTPVALSVTDYTIGTVILSRVPDWRLQITYYDNQGKEFADNHAGVTGGADVLIKALNKANLSTKSLECRALEHLRDEGKIGAFVACAGSPQ